MSSVSIAKQRLAVLLMSDRVNCTPDNTGRIELELYQALSKHMEVTPEHFKVRITRNAIHIYLTGEEK